MIQLNEPFRIRIGSSSERLSADLAFAILPHLKSVSGQEFTPIQITFKQYRADCYFYDVRRWNWPSSIGNPQELARKGFNMLILSEYFLNRDSEEEVIDKNLFRFEEELIAEGISVIFIETYLKDQKTKMYTKFEKVKRWHKATVNNILTEMLDGYTSETLCAPYGVLPYILLDPKTIDISKNDKKHFRALAGFQPWQYEKVLKRWPVTEFPLIHEIGKLKGKLVPETGAVPMSIYY